LKLAKLVLIVIQYTYVQQ